MLRKIVLVILVIVLSFTLVCGCTGQGEKNQTFSPATALLEDISFDITSKEFLDKLSQIDIKVEMPDYNEFPIPQEVENGMEDGRIYNMTDLSFYYKLLDYDIFFTFSYEDALTTISCKDQKISTPMGLCVGDSLDTVKKIYGNNYTENPEDINALQYKADNGYFNVFYQEGDVTDWTLNKHQNINND